MYPTALIAAVIIQSQSMPTPKPAITMAPTTSSQIHAFGYEPTTATLAVQFHERQTPEEKKAGAPLKPGTVYHYANVPPDAYKAFAAAPSKYGHFAKAIKGKFTFSKIS